MWNTVWYCIFDGWRKLIPVFSVYVDGLTFNLMNFIVRVRILRLVIVYLIPSATSR